MARGATVLATASPAKHDLLRGLGAVPIAYGPGLAERVRTVAPDGVQAAIDVVGTDEAVDVSVELVADRSRIATIAAFQRGAQAGINSSAVGPAQTPGQ
nr:MULTISPECIES: zinc-binding dehydrogenase [unclassified Frankia]